MSAYSVLLTVIPLLSLLLPTSCLHQAALSLIAVQLVFPTGSSCTAGDRLFVALLLETMLRFVLKLCSHDTGFDIGFTCRHAHTPTRTHTLACLQLSIESNDDCPLSPVSSLMAEKPDPGSTGSVARGAYMVLMLLADMGVDAFLLSLL